MSWTYLDGCIIYLHLSDHPYVFCSKNDSKEALTHHTMILSPWQCEHHEIINYTKIPFLIPTAFVKDTNHILRCWSIFCFQNTTNFDHAFSLSLINGYILQTEKNINLLGVTAPLRELFFFAHHPTMSDNCKGFHLHLSCFRMKLLLILTIAIALRLRNFAPTSCHSFLSHFFVLNRFHLVNIF